MTNLRIPGSPGLGSQGISASQAHQLGALMLQIRAVADDELRSDLIRDVEEQLAGRLAVSRDRDSAVDATRIVQACSRHTGGLDALVRAVHRIDGDSLPYQAFAKACTEANALAAPPVDTPPLADNGAGKRRWLLAAVSVTAVITVVIVYVAINVAGQPPAVDVIHAGQHKLTASNFITTNDLDKIDLDTGHPGHGGQTQGAWNPTRGGRLADLIVEQDRIHTVNNDARIRAASQRASDNPAWCVEEVRDRSGLVGTLSLTDAARMKAICMLTDENNVAFVRLVRVNGANPTTIDIDVTVVRPRG
jgi:hypothetical protein